MKRKTVLVIMFVALAILFAVIQAVKHPLNRSRTFPAARAQGQGKVVIEIEPGDNLTKVALKLKENWVISNEKIFVLLGELQGADKKLQAGEYEFDQSMSMASVLKILVSGKQRYYHLVIPEGYNKWDIAHEVDVMWPGKGENFLALCSDQAFISKLGLNVKDLEGYLYPDTYFVRKFDTPEKLIQRMVDNFNDSWKPEYEQKAIDLKLTRNDVITIASIVEKEAGLHEEKPMVAAVIYNRLKLKMPLCMDPTVIYGMMPQFNGNITRTDLATYTPYNTYKIKGLPPSPICNPGKNAIKAALWPAKVNYLYFVARGDGSHVFSTNYADHVKAVSEYQKFRAEQELELQQAASVGETVNPEPEKKPGE